MTRCSLHFLSSLSFMLDCSCEGVRGGKEKYLFLFYYVFYFSFGFFFSHRHFDGISISIVLTTNMHAYIERQSMNNLIPYRIITTHEHKHKRTHTHVMTNINSDAHHINRNRFMYTNTHTHTYIILTLTYMRLHTFVRCCHPRDTYTQIYNEMPKSSRSDPFP